MTGGTPETDARQQLVTGLLRWLMALDSEEPWTTRTLLAVPTASGQVRYVLEEARGGEVGSPESHSHVESDVLPEGVGEAVRMLQQLMYTPTGGAWLSATLSVTAEGSGDARFGFDEEPVLPGPDGLPAGLDPAEVAAHLQTFPRPSSATPEWMRGA